MRKIQMLVVSVALALSTLARADGVCARNPEVVKALTKVLELPCERITAQELLQVTQLDVTACELYDPDEEYGIGYDCYDYEGNGLPEMGEFYPGDLDGLTNLKRLVLINNGLKTLPPGVFSGLTSLEVLDLRVNQLRFKSEDFASLPGLKYLALSENDEERPPADLFLNQGKLTELFWDHSQVAELPLEIFAPLKSLLTLRLDGAELKNRALSRLPQLKYLYLSMEREGTYRFTDQLYGLLGVERLELHSDYDRQKPDLFFAQDFLKDLKSLSVFVMTMVNAPEGLPAGMFQGLSALKGVHFNYGLTPSISADLFKGVGPALANLSLDMNDQEGTLGASSEVFAPLTSLKSLAVSGNIVRSKNLHALTELTSFQVRVNGPYTTLPQGALKSMGKVQSFQINGGVFGSSGDFDFKIEPGFFEGLDSLQYMTLLFTGVKTFTPGAFRGLNQVRELYVGANLSMVSIPEGVFEDLPLLESLKAPYNFSMTSFPTEFMGKLKYLKEVNVVEADFSSDEVERIKAAVPPGVSLRI